MKLENLLGVGMVAILMICALVMLVVEIARLSFGGVGVSLLFCYIAFLMMRIMIHEAINEE